MTYTIIRHVQEHDWEAVGSLDIDGEALTFSTDDSFLREWLDDALSRPIRTTEFLGGQGKDHGTRDRIVPPTDAFYPSAVELSLPPHYAFLELRKRARLIGHDQRASA